MAIQMCAWKMKFLSIAAIVAVAVGGCASPLSVSADSAAMPAKAEPSEDHSRVATTLTTEDGNTAVFDSAEQGASGESSTVIRSGYAYIVVDDPHQSLEKLRGEVASTLGKIDSVVVNTMNSGANVTATVRVPRDKFEQFVTSLGDYGDVETLEQRSEEVGATVADLDARIATLKDSIGRLRELMGQTQSISDVLSAEAQITERQAELDGLVAQRQWYSEQIDMSRIDVTFAVEAQYDPPTVSGQLWQTLVNASESMLYTLVWLLPWAVLLVILGGLWKLRRYMRARKAASATPTTQAKETDLTPSS